jgi:hypothetical protein
VYLKTGEMTNSEGFLPWASHFSAGILAVFQGKMGKHRAKRAAAWAFWQFLDTLPYIIK